MAKPTIKKYGDRSAVRQHIGETTRVQQNLHAETDINRIMAKYQKTGLLTHVNTYAGEYGDFSGVPDYKTGLERVQAAEEMFMSLPAKIRDRFNNDPAKFIDFATNPDNVGDMRDMGLAPPLPAAPEPTIVKVLREDGDGDPSPKTKPAKGDQ